MTRVLLLLAVGATCAAAAGGAIAADPPPPVDPAAADEPGQTPAPGRAEEPPALAGPPAAPASARAAPGGLAPRASGEQAPAAEFRFDALRFDGRVTGPQALVSYGRRRTPRAPLHSLRVDFSARIFETVEHEALH